MEAHFKLRYTADHLVESWRRYQKTSRLRFFRYALRAIGLLILAALVAICLHEHQPGPALAIAAAAVGFMLVPKLSEAMARLHFRKSPFRDEDVSLVFSAAGMRATGQNQDSLLGWNLFTAAHELPDGVLLMQGPGVFNWVPDRTAAEPLDALRLRELVSAHVRRFRRLG